MNCTEWAAPPDVQQTLWITVDNPGDNRQKRSDGFPPHAPLFQDKDLFFFCELVGALANAVDLLSARIENVELELDAHLAKSLDQLNAFADQTISPQALVQKLRALRDQIAQ